MNEFKRFFYRFCFWFERYFMGGHKIISTKKEEDFSNDLLDYLDFIMMKDNPKQRIYTRQKERIFRWKDGKISIPIYYKKRQVDFTYDPTYGTVKCIDISDALYCLRNQTLKVRKYWHLPNLKMKNKWTPYKRKKRNFSTIPKP